MMMKKTALAAVVACSALSAAQAGSINATVSAGVAVPGSIAIIDIGTVFNPIGALVTGGSGDLASLAVFSPLTVSSFQVTDNTPFAFSATWGSFLGNIQLTTSTGDPDNRTVGFYALGTFSPLGAPVAGFDPGPMSVTLSATQTGPVTGAARSISISFTAASPPVPLNNVPEPGALALTGVALAGLGLMRRKSVKA